MLTFKKLSVKDKAEYLSKYKNFPPYADYYFNNLFTWLGKEESVYLAYHNEAIIFKFINPFNDERHATYTILAKDSAPELMNYLLREGVKKLEMVPHVTLSPFDVTPEKGIVLDRDNSDYIYDARSLAHMLGPRSKGFLRQVNSFLKRHSEHVVIKALDLRDAQQTNTFVNQIHTWETLYTKNDTERSEAGALDVYTLLAEYLEPECLCVYVDGVLQAFSIYSYPPQEDFVILSHAKSSYSHPGLFDFLVYSTVARAIADKGVKYLNFEQDLGIEGLRNHKLSMRPAYLLEKYTVDLTSLLQGKGKENPTIPIRDNA